MNNKPNKKDMEAYAALMRGLPLVENANPEEDAMWDNIANLQEMLNDIQPDENEEND
jgi:hypothetical protein